MQALFLVLHKLECFDELLVNLQHAGISGGTIINSTGMMTTLKQSENFIVNSLQLLLDDVREESKVIFFILNEKDIEITRKIINDTLGGINQPNTGIMFGIDLAFSDGIITKK